jgi:hypothetical protein
MVARLIKRIALIAMSGWQCDQCRQWGSNPNSCDFCFASR